MKRILPLTGFVAVTVVTAFAFAEPNLDAFAARLAAIRGEVEALSSRVEESKQTQRAEARSLAAQKADLEFQVQREQRRIAQLDAQMEKQRQRVAEATVGGEELAPAVTASIGELRERVREGLPFKTSERLGAIDAVEQKMTQGLLSPQKATVQVWALVEDELRLGRENGLYRQIIELDGEELLVDVARLGMVSMYFRTDDGRVGWVEPAQGRWTWKTENDEAARRQIELLFDAMRKQIRTGYFELPGPVGELR